MLTTILLLAAQAAAAQSAAAAQGTPPPAGPPKTPSDVVARAPAAAWRAIPAEDLMVIDLRSGGRVIVQLAPAFAPVHVSNNKILARSNYWDGAAIYRVQDNYVAQSAAAMNDTTPIAIAVDDLKLDKDERLAVISMIAVRTLGDLRVVLERGEVPKELAAKLKKVLKG